jgi:hypothetical protein
MRLRIFVFTCTLDKTVFQLTFIIKMLALASPFEVHDWEEVELERAELFSVPLSLGMALESRLVFADDAIFWTSLSFFLSFFLVITKVSNLGIIYASEVIICTHKHSAEDTEQCINATMLTLRKETNAAHKNNQIKYEAVKITVRLLHIQWIDWLYKMFHSIN